jgi:hypothetical protein
MDVGAGNYTFFHLAKSSDRGSLVLSNRPMERTDTVIHKVGKFGKVGGRILMIVLPLIKPTLCRYMKLW